MIAVVDWKVLNNHVAISGAGPAAGRHPSEAPLERCWPVTLFANMSLVIVLYSKKSYHSMAVAIVEARAWRR
ncbi:hypothetical protein JIR23_22095 [Bradyrhizobium diazoefficiens]|nr:hypothetical protein [Bradyrhizobium diazoefficiens]QQN62274.1 hypothetical protein JIR23_22095 [Bradyrhizobium diazoefficiens]